MDNDAVTEVFGWSSRGGDGGVSPGFVLMAGEGEFGEMRNFELDASRKG